MKAAASPTPVGLATALTAIRNAGQPAEAADVAAILRTGTGEPSQVRALFGDVALDTLIRLGIAFQIPAETVLASYRHANVTAGAVNPEIEVVEGTGRSGSGS